MSEADALDYVGGYLIGNDLSARDLSRRPGMPDNSSFKNDWMAHKSFDGACPLGPWITLARDVTDPHNLSMRLDVNGVVKQDSNTGQMIFDIREQIADLSARMTLLPGDIILTGTPAGVGNGRGGVAHAQAGDAARAPRLADTEHDGADVAKAGQAHKDLGCASCAFLKGVFCR